MIPSDIISQIFVIITTCQEQKNPKGHAAHDLDD